MSSPDELSEEELRQYVAELREAPAAELVAQAFTMIGAWAEAKLGRPDARTLIDALSGLVQGAESGLDADLVKQMREGVAQLQMAQVQVERQLASQPQQGDRPSGEQPEPRQPQTEQQRPQQARPQPQPQDQKMTDRLWIPGRDPKPPGR